MPEVSTKWGLERVVIVCNLTPTSEEIVYRVWTCDIPGHKAATLSLYQDSPSCSFIISCSKFWSGRDINILFGFNSKTQYYKGKVISFFLWSGGGRVLTFDKFWGIAIECIEFGFHLQVCVTFNEMEQCTEIFKVFYGVCEIVKFYSFVEYCGRNCFPLSPLPLHAHKHRKGLQKENWWGGKISITKEKLKGKNTVSGNRTW
jgi:hypothetical protein